MIKSDKGVTTIEGTRGEILAEYTCIFKEMLRAAPEIVLGVQFHFRGELEKAINKSEPDDVSMVIHLLKILPKGETK